MKNKVLDTSGWREFRIGDLFEKIKTNKLDFKATDLKDKNDELYNLPALTAGVENQGLAYYVPKNNATILKNVISVSANGANAGITFYQPNEFTVLQDSYAIQFIDENMRNKTTKLQYLFIVSIFQSNIKPKFDWKIKAGWDRFKNESIKLPVDSKGNIDWDFMEKSIKETKKEVEKILQSYKALKASTNGGGGGLPLNHSFVIASKQRDFLCEGIMQIAQNLLAKLDISGWQEFRIGDLFEIYTGRDVIISKAKDGDIPLISHQNTNNGVVKYIEKLDDRILFNHKITISLADRGVFCAFSQNQDFHIGTRVKALVFKNQNITKEIRLFFVVAINILKIKFTEYSKNATDKLPDLFIRLPIDSKGQPDFAFMENFIKNIEQEHSHKLLKYYKALQTSTLTTNGGGGY